MEPKPYQVSSSISNGRKLALDRVFTVRDAGIETHPLLETMSRKQR
jgi:hypothetical protein